jgi:hypothetical protein
VDRKLESGQLTGTPSAFDLHGGTSGGGFSLDITWTGVGSAYSSKWSETFTADDESYGSFGTYTSRTKIMER